MIIAITIEYGTVARVEIGTRQDEEVEVDEVIVLEPESGDFPVTRNFAYKTAPSYVVIGKADRMEEGE